jgi:hypothetical protein
MTYPTSATTYRLPFGGSVRVSSTRRFILVRQPGHRREGGLHPASFISKRSDTFDTVYREYRDRVGQLGSGHTDYIIDQAEGTVLFWFNGHNEVHDPKHRESAFLRVEANKDTRKVQA